MKALVGAFNQEKALVGAFSVIVKTDCETDGSFYSTAINIQISDSDSWGWENTNNTINTIIPAQLMGSSSFLI